VTRLRFDRVTVHLLRPFDAQKSRGGRIRVTVEPLHHRRVLFLSIPSVFMQ